MKKQYDVVIIGAGEMCIRDSQQAGAYLHAAGTQSQRCCQLAAIGDAASCNDGYIYGIHHLWHQRHGRCV